MTEEAAGDTGDADGGYVHDPSAFDHEADAAGEADTTGREDAPGDTTAEGAADSAAADPHGAAPDDPHGAAPDDLPRGEAREFDWRGWTLVGMVFLAFVVIPAALYFLPRAQGFVSSLGLSLRDAFLVLPLLPAILLGAMAVWATTRP